MKQSVPCTWQAVDEPAELLLGYVGPAEVQRDGLPTDDPTEHERRDGGAAVQVDGRPESLVAAPAQHRETSTGRLFHQSWEVTKYEYFVAALQ